MSRVWSTGSYVNPYAVAPVVVAVAMALYQHVRSLQILSSNRDRITFLRELQFRDVMRSMVTNKSSKIISEPPPASGASETPFKSTAQQLVIPLNHVYTSTNGWVPLLIIPFCDALDRRHQLQPLFSMYVALYQSPGDVVPLVDLWNIIVSILHCQLNHVLEIDRQSLKDGGVGSVDNSWAMTVAMAQVLAS
jgi:hypothetical protein